MKLEMKRCSRSSDDIDEIQPEVKESCKVVSRVLRTPSETSIFCNKEMHPVMTPDNGLNELNDTDVTASINRFSIFNPSLQSVDQNSEQKNYEKESICKKYWRSYIGLSLAFLSSFLAALSGVLIRVLTFSLNPAEIFTIRSGVQTLIMVPLLFSVKKQLSMGKMEAFQLFLLSLMDTIGSLSTHYAFSMIPVAEASVIINCRHIFTLPLAKFWLKEQVGIFDLFIVLISVGGLLMTCQPPALFGGAATTFTTTRMFGIICSFSSAAFNSTSKCINRKLQNVHLYLILFGPAAMSTLIGACIMTTCEEIQNPLEVKNAYVVIIIVIMSISSNTCQSAAAQLAMAVNVAIVMTLRMPFSVLLEFLIIGTWPNVFSIVGFALSILSIMLLALKKPILSRAAGKKPEQEKLLS